jgi:hypothetical protein
VIDLDSDIATTQAELAESKRIAEILQRHYPGHLWAVNVDARGGMATIQNLGLSGRWGFYIRLAEIVNDPFMSKVVHAGGELLERYRVSRGRAQQDELDNVPVDFCGERIADVS